MASVLQLAIGRVSGKWSLQTSKNLFVDNLTGIVNCWWCLFLVILLIIIIIIIIINRFV